MTVVVAGVGDLVLQQLHGRAPDQPRGLADRGERDDRRGREVDVVVADERDVLGHPDAVGEREGLQQPERQQVVGGEHGLGASLRGELEDLLADPASLQHRQGGGAEGLQGRTGHGLDRPLRPRPAVADLVQGVGAAHVGDPPAARAQEVRHGRAAALDVVHGQRAVLAGSRVLVHQHHRGAAGAQDVDAGPLRGLGGDEHAPDPLLLEQVQVQALPLGGEPRVADDHGLAQPLGGRLRAQGDLVVEGVGRVLHHEPHGARAAGLELARDVVADVAQVLDDPEHAAAAVLGDHLGAVEDVGDGADGHPGLPGHLLDAHRRSRRGHVVTFPRNCPGPRF